MNGLPSEPRQPVRSENHQVRGLNREAALSRIARNANHIHSTIAGAQGMLKSGDDPLDVVIAEILVSTLLSRSQVEPTKFSTTSSVKTCSDCKRAGNRPRCRIRERRNVMVIQRSTINDALRVIGR